MSGLELTFLGVFRAHVDGRPLVSFRSAKVQALLIFLALTRPRTHPRDALAGLLWPDEPEAVAKKNLRQALYRLGAMLEDPEPGRPPRLLVSRATVALNPEAEIAVDVESFHAHLARHALDEAVALCQGELLPGFECTSEPYNDWLRSQRHDLQRSMLGALARSTEECLFRGQHATAAGLARRQIELEPWHEAAHRQLIRAIALSGDRGDAIAHYEALRNTLASELGVEPEPETVELARRVRDKDLMRTVSPPLDTAAIHSSAAARFVGRSNELSALAHAFEQSERGAFRFVVLAGPGGVGKTALAGQFLDHVTMGGADVLRSRAYPARSGMPYQPVTDLLRRRMERENAPDDLLADVWLSELSRLLPELRDRYPDLPAPAPDEASSGQRVCEAIAQLGLALARREPTVLLVDDLHWVDLASLDVIAHAARRWAEHSAPILLLVTVRPEAVADSAALAEWFDGLAQAVPPTRVDLGPLSAAEARQLARAMLIEDTPPGPLDGGRSPGGAVSDEADGFGAWLFARTGGNPLLVTETIKALAATGPDDLANTSAPRVAGPVDDAAVKVRVVPALRGVVEGWLTRISPAARTALTATSVLPDDASFARIRALTDLGDFEAAAALDELIAARLLNDVGSMAGSSHYRFAHELVADVVADLAGPTRRRLLHRRALDILRADGASAARLVRHALGADDPDQALALSLTAGRDAMENLAAAVAGEHFSTALRIAAERGWPPSMGPADQESLLLGLGRTHELAERWDDAARVYETLLTNAEAAGWPTVERHALIRLAGSLHFTTDPRQRSRAEVLLHRARAISVETGDRRAVAEVDLEFAALHFHGGDLVASQRYNDVAMASAEDVLDPKLTARHLVLSSLIHIMHRRWPEALGAARRAAERYEGDEILTQDARRGVAYCAMHNGYPHEAVRLLDESLAFCRRIDNIWGQTECRWKLAHTHLELGDYGKALDLAHGAVEGCRVLGVPVMSELSLVVLGMVQRTIFDLDGARATLVDAMADVQRSSDTGQLLDWVPTELCSISRLQGDWQEAARHAAARVEARGDPAILTSGMTAWDAIDALLRAGDEHTARAEVASLTASAVGNDRYQIVLRRSQAILASWEGDTAGTITFLRDALHLAQRIGLPGETWPILVALADALQLQGDPVAAREAMTDAADIVRRLAATIHGVEARQRFLDADPVRRVLDTD